MADIIYNRYNYNAMKKLVDLEGDTIKVQLHTEAYTPNKDHNVKVDLTNEVSGTGYTAGGAALVNQVVSQDDVNDKGKFDADDVIWEDSVIIARYAVLVDVTLAGDDLICCFDFGVNKTSDNGPFKIQWNAEGLMNLSQAS